MYIKQIITRNIQSHREVVMDLPPTGLVVFTGDNSNGKSVIGKVTKALITGTINKPRKRASLVNRKAAFGEAIYFRDDGTILKLHLAREAAATYVEYSEPEDVEPTIRYISDRNYSEFVRKFGFHYDVNSGISLNLAEADENLLFYKTPNKANGSIIHTAVTDSYADSVEQYLSDTISEARKLREGYTSQIKSFELGMRELKVEDIPELQKKKELLVRLYRNLSAVYFPNLPVIQPVPKVYFADVYYPILPVIKFPKFYNISVKLPDITDLCNELKTLREHKCPTCGRGFDDCGC